MTSWNPIFTDGNLGADHKKIIIDSQKKQIRNILKSYVGLYDPFCELIQNAMDAIERRQKTELIEGKITVVVNLKENFIIVSDNGCGFNELEFKSFLSPNISFKTYGEDRGNKGVGTTYLAFGFHELKVHTKSDDYEGSAVFQGGYDWVFDSEQISVPMVREMDLQSEPDLDFKKTSIEKGSTFKLNLSSDDQEKKIMNLSWRGLNNATAWKYALLLNTPLGHINFDNENPTLARKNIKFDLKVIAKDGSTSLIENEDAIFMYPHLFFESSTQNINEVIEWQKKQIDLGRDSSNIPHKFSRKRVIYDFFNQEQIMDLASRSKTLTEEETSFIEKYKMTAYGCFFNSATKFVDINEKSIGARKNEKVISAGLQICTSNMVQGPMLQIPLTANIGYQKQAFIAIHLENAEPDLGRKGFQPELRILCEKISSMIVTLSLKRWRNLLLSDDTVHTDDLKSLDNFTYLQKMVDHQAKNPLVIKNPNFFKPFSEISITASPISEQDVVVLFSQLIAGGVIRSIELLASSSINQYDGVYRVNIKEPESEHYFHADSNPLGVMPDLGLKLGLNTQPLFLEYKLDFDNLIRDFENEDKYAKDIGLAVVWTMGRKWIDEYQVISTLLPEYSDRRRYHGFTHEIHDASGTKFDCIVLEELIEYLNDAERYKQKYSSIYQE